MYRIKGIILFYQLCFICFLFIGCDRKDSNLDERIKNSTENPKIESFKKISWNNPMLTPFGKDLVSIIRGYFLVGEVDKLMNFIIKPIGYTDGQLKEIIRKSTWGYQVKVTNISWEEDNSFILTVRTTIQNTSGSETYRGEIINDTAKLNLFPDSPRLFVK
jgi:hypothetical protein